MRLLIAEEIKSIGAGNVEVSNSLVRDPLIIAPSVSSHPKDWHVPSIAGGLFLLTTLFSSAATASLKPNIPLWGIPVTASLGLGLCGTALIIGFGVDWLQHRN